MDFINNFYRAKGVTHPRWIKERTPFYPRLSEIRRHLGLEPRSDDESEYSISESDLNVDTNPRSHPTNPIPEEKKIGVDSLMGKDNELFGVGINNVNVLEKGLAPPGSGKKTISLYLEQIDDTTVYPRHVNHKSSEAMGKFVDAVTDLQNSRDGRKGGTKDTGWKNKTRNALEQIKDNDGLNSALTYLLEEQHTIPETGQGNLEPVLVKAHMDENMETNITANSLATRIARDILHSYMSLLNHLAGVSNTR